MGNKRGVLVEISSRLVVLAVRKTPGMEGNEEEGMHDQAHGVVELLGLGECAVAALVRQDPNTSEDEALHSGVCNPGCESKVDIREERDVGDGEVD